MKKALYISGVFSKIKDFQDGEIVAGLVSGHEWIDVVELDQPDFDSRLFYLESVSDRVGDTHQISWNVIRRNEQEIIPIIEQKANQIREGSFSPRKQRALIAEFASLLDASANATPRADYLRSVWAWFQSVDVRENELITSASTITTNDLDLWPTPPSE